MKDIQRLLTFALIAIAGTVVSCADSNQNRPQNMGRSVIPSVEAVEARYGSLPLVEHFSGNVRSENQVALYPEISGRIVQVFVNDGDYVEKGDKLVQLDARQLEQQLQQARAGVKISAAQLKQAEAQLTQLEAQYRRTRQLAERDLTSDLELEQIEAQMASAQADVELVKAQLEQSNSLISQRENELSKTTITAPISGTVGRRNAEVGMQATSGTQLFLIGDLKRFKIEVVLTESMLNRISIGQTAQISVQDKTGKPKTIEAKVSRISPFLNELTRSTVAEIDVQTNTDLLRPGMFVPVDILVGESEQATLIPVSALYTDPTTGEEGVFVASSLGSEIQPAEEDSNNTGAPSVMTEPTDVEFKPITVLARGRMEVGVAGLESGQWIVTVGQDLLAEGRTQARIRAMSWDRIYQLQLLQREDLLKEVLQEQNENASNVTL